MRLMTYNVNYANPDPDSAIDAIASADTDVVLLQEITAEWKRGLERLNYPHQVLRPHRRGAAGIGVLSKLPIVQELELPTPLAGWFPAERMVLQAAFGPLQILHVHLRPAIDGGSWIKGFLTTPPLRLHEIETYWKSMTDLPTVVAGDFNEGPSGLAIAFLERRGLARVPATGPSTWHMEHTVSGTTSDFRLDIDHVMADASLACRDAEVLDVGQSDHRPIVVTVEPRQNAIGPTRRSRM
jgi:endonuclease/exonuclease/phosphatase family metal-dependent hydrolase